MMNVDKVNAVMLRAITLFQQGEISESEESSEDELELELEGLEQPIAQMARYVSEEIEGLSFDKAVDLVSDVLGEAAAQQFAGEEYSDEDLVEWVRRVNPESLSGHVSKRFAA